MNQLVSNQIEKVNMFLDMAKEELNNYKNYKNKYEEWQSKDPKDWDSYPKNVSKSRAKRMMLIAREEMIKLDKML